MENNFDIFALFSTKIFKDLYSYFPCSYTINRNEIIHTIFDFHLIYDAKNQLYIRETYRDILKLIINRNNKKNLGNYKK